MAMPHAAPPADLPRFGWTVEKLLELPDDGNRYECIDGELFVSPSPRLAHQAVAGELYFLLSTYVRDHSVGRLFFSPADLVLDPRTLVQPDLFVLPATERAREWRDVRALLLAVEVLSPSSIRADRWVKRRRYQQAGVPEYWVVDAAQRVVERWRPGEEEPETLLGDLTWQPHADAPPLVIDLPALFRDALGLA